MDFSQGKQLFFKEIRVYSQLLGLYWVTLHQNFVSSIYVQAHHEHVYALFPSSQYLIGLSLNWTIFVWGSSSSVQSSWFIKHVAGAVKHQPCNIILVGTHQIYIPISPKLQVNYPAQSSYNRWICKSLVICGAPLWSWHILYQCIVWTWRPPC